MNEDNEKKEVVSPASATNHLKTIGVILLLLIGIPLLLVGACMLIINGSG